tara:strand:- start:3318 stop:4532 length:1215 start_codon:yes stop_codon:yes gene_type:complete
MKINSNFNIDIAYKPLYTSKKRYFFLTGGRGSLKSHSVADWVLRLTYEEGHGVLYTRYTMTSAKTSIIPEFQSAIERLGLENDFDVTEKDIYNNKTGSFIWFRGIKASSKSQQANLKSLSGVTTLIVEEGEDFLDEKAFDKVNKSIRTKGKQNRVVWIMNPSTREHFIYKRWLENSHEYENIEGYKIHKSTNPKVEHIHTTYKIAKNYLDDEWLSDAEEERINNPVKYGVDYLGVWQDKAEGVILTNWETVKEIPQHLTTIYGVDWGYRDPFTLTEVAIEGRNLYVKELVHASALNPTEQIGLMKSLVPDGCLIIADCADISMILKSVESGLNMMPCLSKDKVNIGLRHLQNYRIKVIDGSMNIIKELNQYHWLDKAGEVAVDKYNHSIDAIRYAEKYHRLSNS